MKVRGGAGVGVGMKLVDLRLHTGYSSDSERNAST